MLDRSTKDDGAGEDLVTRISRLKPGQLDCLRLVDRHMSSKEIAAELGVSPHTVDQRLRVALQILGVERRKEAARVVAEHFTGGASETSTDHGFDNRHRSHGAIPLPYPTASHPRNSFPIAVKLILVVLIAIFSMGSIGLYLAGLDTSVKYYDAKNRAPKAK